MKYMKYKGYKIKVSLDEDPVSPREWDNLGIMICFHRRYTLGDEHHMAIDEAKELVQKGDIISLPLYLYDHSGVMMNTTGFSCPWDSGQVGFIYVSKENIRKEMARPKPLKKGQINPDLTPIKHITKKDLQRVYECLKGEVETYGQYLQGDVHGYVIEDAEGEEIDSCWGFYGDPEAYMIPECKSIIDSLV